MSEIIVAPVIADICSEACGLFFVASRLHVLLLRPLVLENTHEGESQRFSLSFEGCDANSVHKFIHAHLAISSAEFSDLCITLSLCVRKIGGLLFLDLKTKLFFTLINLPSLIRSYRTMSTLPTYQLAGCRVILKNKNSFLQKVVLLQAAGADKLLIISDFDFTVSKFHLPNGQRGASCHKLLEDCGLLGEEYERQARAVQTKYYAHEVDHTLDEPTRRMYMEEWAIKSHDLLVQFGFTRVKLHTAVKTAVDRETILLRNFTQNFFNLLQQTRIPLLIFSAGIADVLEGVLGCHMNNLRDYDIAVISNRMIFSPEQTLIAFQEPIIDVYNKRARAFMESNTFLQRQDVQEKTHLIVLGDSLGDIYMSDGLNIIDDHILTIGFLNDHVEERIESYLSKFDIVILQDPGFDVPIEIVKKIVEGGELMMETVTATGEGL